MAVTPAAQVKDFWPRLRRRSLIVVAATVIIVTGFVTGVLFLSGLFDRDTFSAVLIIMVTLLVVGAGGILIYMYLSATTKRLLDAIVHIAGEPTRSTPPNPNTSSYVRTGFKIVLQTLYELSSGTGQPETEVGVQVGSHPSRNLLEAALSETICGFVVMGHDRHIIYSNRAAPIKIDPNGVSSLQLLFHGDDTLDSWLTLVEQTAVKAERTWTRVADRLPDEENRRFFDVLVSYDKGATAEIVVTLIDRTGLYNIGEQELDFIAFAAHELRGPITVIRGYLDVLEDELQASLQPDHHELFRRLKVSANRLSGYINNILNTSRYDRRHLKLHLVESRIADIYDVIRDDMAMRAGAQNRLLSVTIPDDIPTVPGDEGSLSEVFGNLIDNAIKYSNEGGAIDVSVSRKGDFVEFAVKDNGIGMPGNVVGNLFQKFYRSHRSRETVAGTGIGLYISKAIIESHGGTISVTSEESKGSTFTVSLPVYATVADSLQNGDNNQQMIGQSGGWINNHARFRG